MKSKHSTNYLLVKKYYFEDKFKIQKVELICNVGSEKVNFVFQKPDGNIININVSDEDLIDLFDKFHNTIRNGEKVVIDLSTTPAYNSNNYYNNTNLFIQKTKIYVKKICDDIKCGNSKIDKMTNINEGIIAILKKDFSNKYANEILNNYFEAIGLLILNMTPIYLEFITCKNKIIKNQTRFYSYMAEVDKIFNYFIKEQGLLDSILEIDSKCILDINHLIDQLIQTIKNISDKWSLLYNATGGKMAGELGIKEIIEQYKDLFEIVKPFLRDLVVLLKSESDNINLNSEEELITFLKQKGYSNLIGTIDNNLRNASGHNNFDLSTKGRVKIYNSHNKNKVLLDDIDYTKIIDKSNKILDLSFAVCYSWIMNLEVLLLRILDSPDFKFFVIENKPQLK